MFNKALFRRQRAALNDDPQVKSYGRGLIHSLLIFGGYALLFISEEKWGSELLAWGVMFLGLGMLASGVLLWARQCWRDWRRVCQEESQW